jgi:hypothetical protein
MRRLGAALFLAIATGVAAAGEADVIAVKAARAKDGTWRFDVTIRSNDKGWDYYADAFEVVAPDGRVLGTRVLLHPHDDEQPFTRELDGVSIPAGVDRVVIRARHKPKGYDGRTQELKLPR